MQADMPDWLCQRLAAQYGEADALTIARSLQQSAPLDLRVNILKATRDEVAQRFASEQSAAIELTPYSPHGIRMPQKMNISRHPLFTECKIGPEERLVRKESVSTCISVWWPNH